MTMRFAALGIDHIHIVDHIEGLIAAGAEFAGWADDGGTSRIARLSCKAGRHDRRGQWRFPLGGKATIP